MRELHRDFFVVPQDKKMITTTTIVFMIMRITNHHDGPIMESVV
jgi:hypothetical protein